MNIIEKIEKEQLEKLSSGKQIPDFNPGDTIKVDVKVVEGTRERVQAFEGVCIARGGKGINESFTVRKISYGEGVERVFPLFSPKISSITLVRKGKVRRAKLYYLRDRRGKAARIVEKIEVKKKTNDKKDVASLSKDEVAEIAEIMLKDVLSRSDEQGIHLTITPNFKTHLVNEGYNPIYGARPLRRAVMRLLEDSLAEEFLSERIKPGDNVIIDADDNGNVHVIQCEQPTEKVA